MRPKKHYRCKWEIDVWEHNPHYAAVKAQELIQDPETTATVFDVTEGFNGKVVNRVDLRGKSIQTIRPPKPKWRRIKEERVRLVFGKRCACTGVPDVLHWDAYMISQGEAGLPICEECGDDYGYERTEIK